MPTSMPHLQFLLLGMPRREPLHQPGCSNQLPTSWGPSSMKLKVFNFYLSPKIHNEDLGEEPFGIFFLSNWEIHPGRLGVWNKESLG